MLEIVQDYWWIAAIVWYIAAVFWIRLLVPKDAFGQGYEMDVAAARLAFWLASPGFIFLAPVIGLMVILFRPAK